MTMTEITGLTGFEASLCFAIGFIGYVQFSSLLRNIKRRWYDR